ncbi:CU044_2847 family protein [Phaeacidiphilus oryzae]|jgi:hypothetical protein|uniref:CU044_2847 family protein n=1 Tax=Phaeacidiphilus oryzae TaxID=348818 RepID=UPI0006925D35|nr:CU044_2847 family protein [Phaeacidiphilus oryzae]
MADLMRFALADGGTVLVEAREDEAGMVPAGRAEQVVSAGAASFGKALSSVRDAAGEALARFRELPHAPDEVRIEFGVRLNADAGAVIARTGVEGHLKVSVVWRSGRADGGDGGDGGGPEDGD